MLLGEPPPTRADIHFRLFGFPIRIHPIFWVVAVIMGLSAKDPVLVLLWVIAVVISIIVHELGHAFTQRFYRGHPWITLYALGGLAACDDCDRSPRSQIIISLAGPVAGFCLAAVVIGVLAASGHLRGFHFDLIPVSWELFEPQFATIHQRLAPSDTTVLNLLYINIWWGILNLMPIYPLDGGRVARELFTLRGNAHVGIVRSLQLSIAAAVAVGVFGFLQSRSIFMLLMFGYLAYLNYQTIQAYQQYDSGRPW